MKQLFFIVLSLNVIAQAPNIVEVTEWTAKNQALMIDILNDYADSDSEVTGVSSFVLEVIDGNKVYYCRGFESMQDLLDSRMKRWGEDGTNSKVMNLMREKRSEDDMNWASTGPKKIMSHVFRLNQNLSYVPKGVDLKSELPKLTFRRHIIMDVHEGPGNMEKFRSQIRSGIENDIKLKNNYIRLMFTPIYGGVNNGDFMMIVMDKSRSDYYNGLAERNKKRDKDSDWKKIQSENVASWIQEEDIKIHY